MIKLVSVPGTKKKSFVVVLVWFGFFSFGLALGFGASFSWKCNLFGLLEVQVLSERIIFLKYQLIELEGKQVFSCRALK